MKTLDPKMEAAKMNAGLFHTRNSPRPVLSGTVSRMINKVKRSAKKAPNRSLKNANSSGVNLGERKKGPKAKPRVDCWRGQGSRLVPKLNFLAPNGDAIRSGKKCSTRKKNSRPKRFCSISDNLPVKKMANKYEEVYLGSNKTCKLLTPASLLNASSGCKKTPEMKLSVTLVPRTSSIMRSKSQTKRNLRSGSIRHSGRIGLVRGMVHRFEESYEKVDATVLRKKPLENRPSMVDENANCHHDSTLDLRVCSEKYLESISVGADCLEECLVLKDDVFDEVNGNNDDTVRNRKKSRGSSVQNNEFRMERESLSKVQLLDETSVRYIKNSEYAGNNTTMYTSAISCNNTTMYTSMIDNSAVFGNNTTLFKSMIDQSAMSGNKTTIDEIGLEASEMIDDNDSVWTSAVEDNSTSTIFMDCSSNETTPVIAEVDRKKSRVIPSLASDSSREDRAMEISSPVVQPPSPSTQNLEPQNCSESGRAQRCSIS